MCVHKKRLRINQLAKKFSNVLSIFLFQFDSYRVGQFRLFRVFFLLVFRRKLLMLSFFGFLVYFFLCELIEI